MNRRIFGLVLLVVLGVVVLCTGVFSARPNPRKFALGKGLLLTAPPPPGGYRGDDVKIHGKNPAKAIAALNSSERWRKFQSESGDGWEVKWNTITGTPHFATGRPINMPGMDKKNKAAVEQSSRAFIDSHKDLMKAQSKDLKLGRLADAGGRWHISFQQTYRDIPVLGGHLTMSYTMDGRLISFGSDVYPDVKASTEPRIYEDEAILAALGDPAFRPEGQTASTPQLTVVPVSGSGGFRFLLCWRFTVSNKSAHEKWEFLVDATTGKVVGMWNALRYATVSGTVQGDFKPEFEADTTQVGPTKGAYVTIGGVDVTTNDSGYYSSTINHTVTLRSELKGPYCDIKYDPGTDSYIQQNVSPGQVLSWTWDSSRYHAIDESSIFRHINYVHDYFKTIDPGFADLDYSMPTTVAVANLANAYWDGEGVTFGAGDGVEFNSFGLQAEVVYHEYTHGVTDKIYTSVYMPYALEPGAMHEGWSDYFGCGLTPSQNPYVGDGGLCIGYPDGFRSLDNTYRRETDWINEPHGDSEMFSGGLWEARQAVGSATMDPLVHYARYALALTFEDYLTALLIEDDTRYGDNNLSNGTPHGQAIFTGFGNHGIGGLQYVQGSMVVDDSTGNGDGKLDPGETANISVVLTNGWADATGIAAALSTEDEYVSISKASSNFPDANRGSLTDNTADKFLVSVASNCPTTHTIDFGLHVTAGGGPYAYSRDCLFYGVVAVDQLSCDDGQNDYYLGYGSSGGFAVRLTPSEYPCFPTHVRLYPFESGSITVKVWDDDGSNGAPGTILGSVTASVNPADGWYDVDISEMNLMIESGSVYVGWVDSSGSYYNGFDFDPPYQARTWVFDGSSWSPFEDFEWIGNAMVRLIYSNQERLHIDPPFEYTFYSGVPVNQQLTAASGVEPYAWEALSVAGSYSYSVQSSSQYTQRGTAQGWRSDEKVWSYTLPFSFPFYGTNYNSVNVCSNGYIDFVSTEADYTPSADELMQNVRIAPLWDDLDTSAPKDIYVDTSVAGQVAIQWRAYLWGTTTQANVTVVLFSDGQIRFDYGSGNTSLAPTIGVSAGNGTDYLLIPGYDGASTLTSANSVMISPVVNEQILPPGVTLDPNTGLLSGTPTTTGDYPAAIRVTDSSPTPMTSKRRFTFHVVPSVPPPAPGSPSPEDGATGVYTDTSLSWNIPGGPYSEAFSDGLAQDWTKITDAQWSVVSGEYAASAGVTAQSMQTLYNGQTWTDLDFSATIRRSGGNNNTPSSLLVRATDDFSWPGATGSAYRIGISADGRYFVGRWVNGVFTNLQNWTTSSYLNMGNASNNVRVVAVGSTFSLYLNGNLAWTGTDSSPIPGPGRIGLAGYSGSTIPTAHYFDNVRVSAPSGLLVPAMASSTGESYDVYLGTSPQSLGLIHQDIEVPTCSPGQLAGSTTYYWKVVAKAYAGQTPGPIWSFTTVRPPAVLHVESGGSDSNSGFSWSNAKQTVSGALQAAIPGDQVWVAAGTYLERIHMKSSVALYGGFAGTETSLVDRDWVANETILDGAGQGTVVTARDVSATASIDGFTIRNGSGTLDDPYRRGEEVWGGGIYCRNASPMIANNKIIANSAGVGGGIACSLASHPQILHNVIADNTADDGAGLYADSGCEFSVSNGVFSGNRIASAGSAGSGTIALFRCNANIISNTIAGNDAGALGAVLICDSVVEMDNNIVAFNSSGVNVVQDGATVVEPVLNCNDVYGNEEYNFSHDSQPGWNPTGANGNISADPMFADIANGDLHLTGESPCLDAGSDISLGIDWLDMDCGDRIFGEHVDIGADEFVGYTVSGIARLGNFDGNAALVPVTVELREVGGATRTRTIYLSGSGSFLLPWVKPGTYNIAFKASHWLRDTVANITVSGDVQGYNFTLINGDCNGDNKVGALDNVAVRKAYGSTPIAPSWNPNADLNGDNRVSSADLAIVRRNYGRSGDL